MESPIGRIGSFLPLCALWFSACSVEPPPSYNPLEPSPSDKSLEPSPSDKPGVTEDHALTAEDRALNDAQEKLRPVADSVEASFRADPAFSNVSMDASSNSLIVYREGGASAAARARLPSANPTGAKVEIRAAFLSKARVDDLIERITQDQKTLQAAGVDLISWGGDGEGGPFHIGVKKDPDHALTVLRAQYPAFASAIDVSVRTSPVPFGRLNDTAPYFGGSRLNLPGGFSCTSGYPVRNSFGLYLLTAYHCSNGADERVYNGQNTFEGTFVSFDKAYDAAFVQVSSNTAVDYAGVLGSDATYGVQSAAHPLNGEIVCGAGSWSGARCNAKIGASARFTLRSDITLEVYTVDLWNADQQIQHALWGDGDSGGPVYVGGTAVHPRGIISSGDLGTRVGCPDGQPRNCVWRGYFADAALIGERHGLRFTGF